MATIQDYYNYATLATASYVRMGGKPLTADAFVQEANAQQGGRLPTEQAEYFFDPANAFGAPVWNILSYYGADASEFSGDRSGFGATLFQDSANGEKVLALRGTEPSEEGLFGIEYTGVDLLSGAAQIGLFGLALTQVVSMANYVARLRQGTDVWVPQVKVQATTALPSEGTRYLVAEGSTQDAPVYLVIGDAGVARGLDKIAPGEVIKVTGHSLGGHLAVMAAKLFPGVIDPGVVVFNAAGYDPDTASFLGLLEKLSPLPAAVISGFLKRRISEEIGIAAKSLATSANHLSTEALEKINGQLGRSIVLGSPSVVAIKSEDLDPADDISVVASSLTGADRYGPSLDLPTEENNHVVEPLMDALALQALIEPMSGTQFTAPDLVRVLEASANDRARSYEEVAEGLYRLARKDEATPVAAASNASLLTNEAVLASSLFSVSDADGDAIARYEFWDDVNGGGYWRVNGVQQAAAQAIEVSAAELADTYYVAGSSGGTEQVWVRANDGLEWGAWKPWNMTSALHIPNAAPVVSASSPQSVLLGQPVSAGSLFTVTDADADAITAYEFWDSTAGAGHWAIDGIEQGVNVSIAVSDLADVDFVGASEIASDLVWVRANDGQTWSDWKAWTMQSSPHLANAAPVVSAANGGLLRDDALDAAALFSVSDADGDAITQYQFWDDVNGGGHWRLNGVQQAAGQNIDVAAADLANLDYVGGANAGTEQVWVRANDGLAWGAWKNWLMSTEGGMLRGGLAPDTLNGEAGPTVLEGGGGGDTLSDTDGNNLFSGGDGSDEMTGGAGNDLFAGAEGDDTIHTGAGANVIAYNAGDGYDLVFSDAAAANTLSFGGGIGYDDLSLSKSGNDLIVNTGSGEGVVLKDWYAGNDNVLDLQVILDATEEFDAQSQDPLYNRKVQTFDFRGMVAQFDQALAQSPGLTSWALTNALLQFHLSGSDDEALGGDLAYWYGKNNGFTGIGLQSAQQVIGASGFGADAQTLRPFNGLQEGFVKLA